MTYHCQLSNYLSVFGIRKIEGNMNTCKHNNKIIILYYVDTLSLLLRKMLIKLYLADDDNDADDNGCWL